MFNLTIFAGVNINCIDIAIELLESPAKDD